MSYNLDWSFGTTKTSIKVEAGDKDTSSTSLSLYGKGSPNYGEGIQENLIRMLENWASPSPPPHPTQGQLWYNTVNNTLNIFTGATFEDVHAKISGALDDFQQQTLLTIIQVDARVDNVLNNVNTNTNAIVKETQDRIAAINAETLARTAAVIAEAQARNDAIASGLLSESQSRASAIAAEASARQSAISDGLLAESLARQAAITVEQTARQTALDSLSQQISTLSASVDSASAGLQTEQTVRASAIDTVSQQINTIAARIDSAESSIVDERTTRANAISALAQTITDLTASTNNNLAAIQAEQQARTTAESSFTTQITGLLSTTDSLQASIDSEKQTRTDQYSALSTTLDTLTTSVNSNSALISQEQTTRSDAISSLSEQVNSVYARTQDNAAAIQTEQQTRADGINALSSRIDTLVAGASGDATAAIDAETTARTTADSALGSRIDSVTAVANAKNKTYSQAAAPSSPTVGDLWIDTSNNNQLKRWNGSSWVASDDARIAQNQAAIAAEQTARANADSAQVSSITSLTAVANAKNQCFKQSTAPTAVAIGDLWIDTGNGNIIKRWDGSTWAASDDARIGQALTLGSQNQAAITAEQQARADGDSANATSISQVNATASLKNRTFSQTTAPTALATGDLWIDTGNGNLLKRWNGTAWVAIDDTRIAANIASITSEQTARANADTALGSRIDSVVASNQTNATAITTEQTARISADNALGTRIDTLSTKTDSNAAAITTESQARTDADTALGSRIDAVVASVSSNTAAITTEQKARADGDSANASSISSVSAIANSKNRTFYQSTAPTATATGDLWIDTGNNNQLKRWSGTAWVASDDARLAANAAAITTEQTARISGDSANATQINNVSAVANSKNVTFSQNTTPTASATGDLWIDTGNNNQLKRWNGTSWAAVDDARIASALASITAEQTARASGDSANATSITNLTTTVNTKTTTFRQSTAPTAAAVGDTWIDTGNGNLLKFWNGTAWVASDDARLASTYTLATQNAAAITTEQQARADGDTANATQISNVSATANSKNRTFYQSTAPTAYTTGDLWIDTGNNNQLKRWNGTAWTAVDDLRTASNAAAISTEQTARANADTALGARIDTVTASANSNAAAITTETQARTDADTALGVRIDTVTTSANNNAAAITAEQKARADGDTANANTISSVSAVANSKNKTFSQSATPTASATGDLWIDTGNNNQLKRWNGTAWVASDDARLAANAAAITAEQTARASGDSANATSITNLTATVNTKTTTFSQNTTPTATATGDLWIDTGNNNQLKRWNGTAWVAVDDARISQAQSAITAEQTARASGDTANATSITNLTATVNTKTTTFSQSTAPTATATGDLWIDTGNNNQLKRWSGTAWVAVDDARIAQAQSAITAEQSARASGDTANATSITNLTATVNTKVTTFSQSTTPTAAATGDLWIDTGNNNQLKRWNGTAWVASDDTRLAANAAAITAEQTARVSGDTANANAISSVSAVANSKNVTFYQSTAPTATAAGDLWIDTGNNNQLKRWSGTAWIASDDARLAANAAAITAEQTARANGDSANASLISSVSAVANSKTTTFSQNTAPTATATGDLWIDTGNGNLLKRWNGTAWVAIDDTRIAQAQSAITAEQNARASGDSANATSITNLTATVNTKTTTFSQSATPTATATGDLWIDTGNGNLLKRWNGTAWVAADDGRISTLSAAITTEQTARTNADTAISQRLDTISAAADFDTVAMWAFDDTTAQGWTVVGATMAVDSVGSSVTITSTTNDPQFLSPGISISGNIYPLVRARIRRVSGTGWDGSVLYSTSSHGFSASYRKTIADPGLGLLSNWTTLEWDLSNLTAGGTDWQSNTVLRIRLDFGAATNDVFQVDWVGIGRSGPGASKAEITTEQNARISGDQSLASSISTLTSTVNGHTTSIQTTQTTVNGLSAQYSVKIDNNGYVTGYGLASTPVNGTPTSIFNIVADKFALTKPTLNNGVPVVPFSVDTTTTPATIVLDGSIQLKNTNISNGAVTPNKMAVTSLSAISSNIGTITSGTLSSGTVFAGSLSAATGTFSGSLNAATGTFAGSLSAATGTFSGDISAANGTFSGTLRANIVDTSQMIQGSVSNVDFYSYNNYANTTQNISVTPTLSVPADSLVMFFAQETHSGQANLSAVTGYWTVQGLNSTSNLVTLNANGGAAGRYLTSGTYNLKGVLSCAGGQGYLELSAVKIKR